jgi:uncharacterized DUF497 family protein
VLRYVYTQVIYEWGERKNAQNFRKHGIRFETAQRVFDDPSCIIEESYDDPETGEPRWKAIGIVPQLPAVLVVIHVYRYYEWKTFQIDEEPKEVTRILSARAADSSEVRRYQGL